MIAAVPPSGRGRRLPGMSDSQNNKPVPEKPAMSSSRRRRQAEPSAAFDIWLDRDLHRMFDKVAAEPIPDDLLRLIDADRKK
jgi:Anti-sigma factor NepR